MSRARSATGAGCRSPGRSCSTPAGRRSARSARWWWSSSPSRASPGHSLNIDSRAPRHEAADTLFPRMVILDRRLDERAQAGDPVNVALVGSGFMGRAVVRRLRRATGIRLVAVANRTLETAEAALTSAGERSISRVEGADEVDAAAAASRTAVTSDAGAVC